MRNIFLIIQRFHVLLLFLVLQIASVMLLVRYSRSHQAKYMQYAYEVTGRINSSYQNVTGYFALAKNNRDLAQENARLSNYLASNYTLLDTSTATGRPSALVVDTAKLTRKYLWRPARVVNNSVSFQNNYITLERGRKQGITEDMAVVGAAGIVGIVTDVSENMSVVMSLLHRKSNTSVALAKNGITGILEWDGNNPQRLQLRGVPKSAGVAVGDTVITSNLSLNFPAGLMVGTIASYKEDEEGNNYLIQIKPGVNFYTLDHVSVIENLFLKEQQALEGRIPKQ